MMIQGVACMSNTVGCVIKRQYKSDPVERLFNTIVRRSIGRDRSVMTASTAGSAKQTENDKPDFTHY
jgi:hypothetical protein